MTTMTRINAFALLAAAAVALGAATWDAEIDNSPAADSVASAELVSPSFTGKVDTGWLPATEARRSIEELSATLDRLALEHDAGVRVLDSAAELRTRTAEGLRLAAPLARFERAYEFRVHDPRDLDSLRSALARLAVELEPAAPGTVVLDEHYASRPNAAGF